MTSGMMKQVYRIVGICLGIPPKTFVWQFVDKTKQVLRGNKSIYYQKIHSLVVIPIPSLPENPP